MRKILIDKTLESKVDHFFKSLFSSKRANFVLPLEGLKNLNNSLGPIKNKKERIYIQNIVDNYEQIVKATPSRMKNFVKEFNLLDGGILDKKIKVKDKYKFHELIVKAMRYDELRNSEFHHFVNTSGIKTCVYCNSQLAIISEFSFYDKKEKKRKPKTMAKFELDHYYSKSKYPFLSTSFYNLYPVCGNCNRAKSDIKLDFELYTKNPKKLEIFKFWIDDKSIINYWLESVPDYLNLNIYFESVDGDYKYLNEYNKMFAIQGIYDTQKDIAEELIHKAKVYTDAYNQSLINNYSKLFPDKSVLDKLIVGNYADSAEVFKRPMAKYSQDIAKQLGLI